MAPRTLGLDRILDHLLYGEDEALAGEFFADPALGREALRRVRALLDLIAGEDIGPEVRRRLAGLEARTRSPPPAPAAVASMQLREGSRALDAAQPAEWTLVRRGPPGGAGRAAPYARAAATGALEVDRLRGLRVDGGGIGPVVLEGDAFGSELAEPSPAGLQEPARARPPAAGPTPSRRRHRALLPGGGVLELVLSGEGAPALEIRIIGLQPGEGGISALWISSYGPMLRLALVDGRARIDLSGASGVLRIDAARTLELPISVAM